MNTDGQIRQALAAQLADKCRRHHLVVWDDPAKHYEDVVEAVVPDGWQLERYDGSWWDLRRRLEPSFSAAKPPKLVAYIAASPPPADPLEEVRQAGGSFKRLLPTLLTDALGGELGAARLADLGSRCVTLLAAEDALAGPGDLDPLLIAMTGAREAEAVIAEVLVGQLPSELPPDAFAALAKLCGEHLGASIQDLRDYASIQSALARLLVLAAIAGVLGDESLPSLVANWQPLSRYQSRNAIGLVARLGQHDSLAKWGRLADQASQDLQLAELPWDDRLASCDAARAIDELAFHEAARRSMNDPAAAHGLAHERITRSRWLRWRDDWSTRALGDLSAVRAIARFRLAVTEHPVPSSTSLDEIYRWYADGGWRVDRSYRLMEGARFGLARPGLDRAYTTARDSYDAWLDRLLAITNSAAATTVETSLPRQAETYATHVRSERVALVIVDAMRLEIGHRLAEVLDGVAAKASVDFALAVPPTITRLGMASLLPDAASEGLGVQIDNDALTVLVGARAIRTVADRTAAYRRAAGRVEDHPLSDWLGQGDDVLAQRVADADLLVVRAQEIDAAGEAGLATVRWSQIDATVDALAILITRLAGGGVNQVIVTADHGFIALGRALSPSQVLQTPAGAGFIEHGRAWVGRPAAVPDGCTTVALADFGVRSAESIVLPDGMTVFGKAGAGFFHGGISPQEALVPVVLVDLDVNGRRASELLTVHVEVTGGKISAEAFSIRVKLDDSLFASAVAVRISAADMSGDPVARLVSGESVDARTGTVHLEPSTDASLTFLVTSNLDKGAKVLMAVVDASTGRVLATARATVARDLRPEEEW